MVFSLSTFLVGCAYRYFVGYSLYTAHHHPQMTCKEISPACESACVGLVVSIPQSWPTLKEVSTCTIVIRMLVTAGNARLPYLWITLVILELYIIGHKSNACSLCWLQDIYLGPRPGSCHPTIRYISQQMLLVQSSDNIRNSFLSPTGASRTSQTN